MATEGTPVDGAFVARYDSLGAELALLEGTEEALTAAQHDLSGARKDLTKATAALQKNRYARL